MKTKSYFLSGLTIFLFSSNLALSGDCPTPTVTPSGTTTLCGGGSSQLLEATAGDSYQWYKDGSPIEGATDQTYLANRSAEYYVEVSSEACGTLLSDTATIIKNPFPVSFIMTEGSNVVCAGDSVQLSAETFNVENPQYQWLRSGVPIPGATNIDYFASTNGKYRVVVTNPVGNCSRQSGASNITLMRPTIQIIPDGPTEFCPGNGVNLTTLDNTGFGSTYQWTRYNNEIPGATDPAYTASLDGHYRVTVTSMLGCTKTSHFIKLTYGACRMEGVNESSDNASLYPNPTNGMLYIDNTSAVASAEVFNTLGQKVLTSFETGQVDLSTLPNGFYMIKLYDANHELKSVSKVQKVVR